MTNPLSPAARAVLDAYANEVSMPRPYEHERRGLAAALRAAAGQLTSAKAMDTLRTIANELDPPSS